MHNISFGSLLKEARISKGFELQEAARRLRIRPDILQAIENSDFDRMPPRGYSRNMISAYAKFLGLNPQELTRLYLDQAYAHQIGRAYQSANQSVEMKRRSRSESAGAADSPVRSTRYNQSNSSSRRTRSDGEVVNGRRHYSQDDFRSYPGQQNPDVHERVQSRQRSRADRNSSSRRRSSDLHPSRHPAITEGKYLNLYAQQDHAGRLPQSRISKPLIAAIIAIVVVIAIIIFVVSSCTKEPETTNIPVTGLENVETTEQQEPVEQAPTEFTLEYSVAEGYSAWIEVYIDDELQDGGQITGPAEQSYSSSTDIRFVCGSPDGVTLKVNGEEVQLETNSDGIVNETFTFQDILDQWYADHPDASPSDSNSSSDSSQTDGSTSSSDSDSSNAGQSNSSST